MHRRELLYGTGAALSVGLAGCGSAEDPAGRGPPVGTDGGTPTSTPTPEPAVVSTALDWEQADDGRFVVVLGVENTADEEATEPVAVTVTHDGEPYTRSREVTLGAGDEETLRFRFDRPYGEVVDGGIDVEVQIS